MSRFSVSNHESPFFRRHRLLARRKQIYRDFVVRARATSIRRTELPLAGNRYIVTLPCHNSGRHTRPHPQSLDKRPALIHQQQQQQQKRPQQQQQQQQHKGGFSLRLLAGIRYVVIYATGPRRNSIRRYFAIGGHATFLPPCLTPRAPPDARSGRRRDLANSLSEFPSKSLAGSLSVVTLPYLIATDPKAQPKKSRTHADGSHAHHHHVLALRCRQQFHPPVCRWHRRRLGSRREFSGVVVRRQEVDYPPEKDAVVDN
ncbi:hypothetical protein DFP72DRAFT_1179323 [Ephemerocybe angulata]|uniref:Uncharacterized protein n=1 Tax=Ephemerocybe angulata TaxID=980116 RepID=A0A8H6HAM4_9AGAR|nr:hypothetical protein DFP72DRAFT_1179323 [Tulosesus angulatus]